MKNHGHNNHKDRYPHGPEPSRKTVRVLGTDFQRAQLWIVFCAAVPLALAARYGFFEYLDFGPLQTVSVSAPLLAASLALAFIQTHGRYLYMLLADKLTNTRKRSTAPVEEDERA